MAGETRHGQAGRLARPTRSARLPCDKAGGVRKSPAGCAVSRVLFRRRVGRARRRRRPFLWARPYGGALPGGTGLRPVVSSPPGRRGPGAPCTGYTPVPPQAASLCHQGKRPTRGIGPEPSHRRCLALHPVGFAVPAVSRPPRCALTAPFHPCSARPKPHGAVYFLWHFPYPPSPSAADASESFGGRWALPTTAVQWCSDFPPPASRQGAAFRASGPPDYTPSAGTAVE